MKSRKGLAHDIINTSAIQTPALFMTSRTQTARHKMAALTVMFLFVFFCFQTLKFNKLHHKSTEKRMSAVVCLFFVVVFLPILTRSVNIFSLGVPCKSFTAFSTSSPTLFLRACPAFKEPAFTKLALSNRQERVLLLLFHSLLCSAILRCRGGDRFIVSPDGHLRGEI